jgi:acetyl esterase/lipase
MPPQSHTSGGTPGPRYTGYAGEHALRVHRSRPGGNLALVVLFPPGGFLCRDPESADRLAAALALRLASTVVVPDYTLATERPFPAAAEDGYAALQWAHLHAGECGCAQRRLVVAGIEAGGNLAAVAAMMARDRGGPPLAAQVLLGPMLDPTLSSPSMLRSSDARPARCDAGYRAYLPHAADRMHPYAAPATATRLAGLPPALVLTANGDPLRDEAEGYGARLIAAGVTTQVARLECIVSVEGWEPAALDAIADFLGPRLVAAART